ncbi:hypothetical protein [sulfur-oxidizing endosymbiont of Gigantopelta aegis]|uniref:hypothetical protein n=1 Tax=sulfur-oxidizing endosymbiont of Gigantopelta aegis TaxID=2794934 RepID=UPI0018DBAAE6|nr:hypothetical protein [sulfur-oxidizing endosymbiont of Gigantopelta aegis]
MQALGLTAEKRITTELNGIYFVKIIDTNKNNNLVQIKTCPDFGRNEKVKPARKFWIEPDFLYPLVKGAGDIQECYVSIKKDLYVLVPNKGITKQL